MRAGVHPNEPSTRSVAPQEGLRREGRIAVCHIASGDRWAGAEAQLANLLTALGRRAEFQLSLILLNEGKLAEEARACGVEVKIFPESRMGFAKIFYHAARFLRGKGIHILHSHRYKENLLAALLAWRCRIPVLIRTQHGLPEPFSGTAGYKHALFQRIDRWIARNVADCTISVSAEQTGHLTRYIDRRKVATIRNGIDTARVRSSLTRDEAKRRLGIEEGTWLVGTAGRLDPVKRLDIFLEMAKEAASRVPNLRFAIAGKGSSQTESRLRALSSAFGEKVVFLGPRLDVYDVLRALDVFVICSDHEGLPMVLLEALCLGVPVLARPVGGIPEVIRNGVTGLLVDSSDPRVLAEACLGLLGDSEKRSRLAANGTRLVTKEFSAEGTATQVAKLYRSL